MVAKRGQVVDVSGFGGGRSGRRGWEKVEVNEGRRRTSPVVDDVSKGDSSLTHVRLTKSECYYYYPHPLMFFISAPPSIATCKVRLPDSRSIATPMEGAGLARYFHAPAELTIPTPY